MLWPEQAGLMPQCPRAMVLHRAVAAAEGVAGVEAGAVAEVVGRNPCRANRAKCCRRASFP